jgi:DNA-binding NarL/FixJ family response regulator
MADKNGEVKGILLVDDHPIVRQGIRSLLAQAPDLEICAEAESAAEALSRIDKSHPDVAIVDISLVGTDGLELTKAIRARDKNLPILIMSMHDESLYAERALRAGANGYIMKQEVSDKIVGAIRRVLNGDIYVSDEIRQRILLGIRSGHVDAAAAPVDRLSDRELEVFRLIGQGSGTRQIAEQLHLSVKTIETYRAHIKEKLNLDSATELVRFAVQWVEQGATSSRTDA